jgi:DNA-damage-inducible protein J
MATVPTQVRIEENLKQQASELFSQLGLDMSSAINVFLKQSVLRGGLPFSVELPKYRSEVIEAMEESKRISRDPNVKSYTNISEMFKEILADETES